MKKERAFSLVCQMTIMGIGISLFGWIFEVAGRWAIYSVLEDRGFITLPLCPIYGVTLISVYLLFGTPTHPSLWLSRLTAKAHFAIRFAVYFLFVCLLASAIELVTAFAFAPFGVRLWTYAEQPLNLFGAICLGYSVLWGALITAFMWLGWERIFSLLARIPKRLSISLAISLGTIVAVDFFINCAILVSESLKI